MYEGVSWEERLSHLPKMLTAPCTSNNSLVLVIKSLGAMQKSSRTSYYYGIGEVIDQ